jgi:septum formation topological specificity factor MinE
MKNLTQKQSDILNSLKEELLKLQEKYSLRIDSDTGDVYISYQSSDTNRVWENIEIGWEGDGSSLKVIEKTKEDKIKLL